MDKPKIPLLYKRKYEDSDDIALCDLQEAYHLAARKVADGGENYLALFERLEDELLRRESRKDAMARALKIAKRTDPDI